MALEAKRKKHSRPQLKVVFDTNVLYTGSASDLVSQEAAKLIKDSNFSDLEIQWHLPEIVRHERQYQMQRRALEMLPTIGKLEKLLGHNLAFTNEILFDRVEKAVMQGHEDLGLLKLALDRSKVDWNRVTLDSVYRRPPFQAGEKEKGFRDCLVIESFVQLVGDSPKTPKVCRIVLVSADKLIAEAVQSRIVESTNTAVVPNLDELKGLINTLVSEVDEGFLALLKPKAQKMFFVPKDESTLFYKENIREMLTKKFGIELLVPPSGATSRNNGTWRISAPNFERKAVRRIQWTSRIEIETEASKTITQSPNLGSALLSTPSSGSTESIGPLALPATNYLVDYQDLISANWGKSLEFEKLGAGVDWHKNIFISSPSVVTSHKGVDAYEVLWGADVTSSRELRRPSIDEIKHVGATWEAIT
jgi:PIN domain